MYTSKCTFNHTRFTFVTRSQRGVRPLEALDTVMW